MSLICQWINVPVSWKGLLVTIFHSRNTDLWSSVHSLPCPHGPAQPSWDVSDHSSPQWTWSWPLLQADVLVWPQPISNPMEMPDAWDRLWLPPCLTCSLARGSGVGPGCEAPVLPVPSRRPHSPQGAPSPYCTLTAFFLRSRSLHCMVNANMFTTVLFHPEATV